jgi:hypothetical protein
VPSLLLSGKLLHELCLRGLSAICWHSPHSCSICTRTICYPAARELSDSTRPEDMTHYHWLLSAARRCQAPAAAAATALLPPFSACRAWLTPASSCSLRMHSRQKSAFQHCSMAAGTTATGGQQVVAHLPAAMYRPDIIDGCHRARRDKTSHYDM